MWNFCNVLFKGYSVESSVCGKVKIDGDLDDYMILSRHNLIGIYSFKKGVLDLKKEIELFANVKFIKRIPAASPNESDLFFLLEDDLSYTFCSLDDGKIVSKGEGEINLPSSARLEIDSIKVIADTDHASYIPNYTSAGIKYVAVYAYKEILNVFPFKYIANGGINVEKPFILRLSQENIIDIIPLDPKLNKTQKHMIGIISAPEKTANAPDSSIFQAFEFGIQTEDLTKKALWEIPSIKEPHAYKICELSDGNLMVFVENNIL